MPPPKLAFDALAAFDIASRSGYGSSRGELGLREALCNWYATQFGRTTTPDQHVVTNGAKQAIMVALLALCDTGDRIAIQTPYWPSYLDITKLVGLSVELLPYYGATVDIQTWIDHVSDQTRVIIYSSPSNPTGSVLSPADIRKLTHWAKETNRWIIADEIYQFQYYQQDGPSPSVLHLPSTDAEHVLHISSASKTFALMGHRIGWITAHPTVVTRCASIASNIAGNVNIPAQSLLTRALSTPRSELARRTAQLKHQRDVLCSALAESIPWLRWSAPDGGLFVWCELVAEQVGNDWTGDAIAAALLTDKHVAVVPGSVFGKDNALRLSFTEQPAEIVDGIERIKTWGEARR